MATLCEELTHWKISWCWKRLKVGREGGDRGWDGWMASLTRWTWVWVSSRSWWWTGKPGMLQSMGSQGIGHNWVTELNVEYKLNSKVTLYSLLYSFSYLEPVCFFMPSSNCCFLTCIQISQEAGKVVWYSHPFKNFPVFCDPCSQTL